MLLCHEEINDGLGINSQR